MSGVEVAFGTHIIDSLAGLIFGSIIKHRPADQTSSGDDYVERSLALLETHFSILGPTDRRSIRTELDAARKLRDVLETRKGFKAMAISHEFNSQSRKAYTITKKLSTQARMRHLFSSDVANAVINIAERESGPTAFSEDMREDLRSRVVNSIESSPEGRSYSHENIGPAQVAEAAEKAWMLVNIHNTVNVINGLGAKNVVNIHNAVNVENAGRSGGAVNIVNSVGVTHSV